MSNQFNDPEQKESKMEISCMKNNLSRGLTIAGRAIGRRSDPSATKNILLESEDGMLKLSAANSEFAMSTVIPAMVRREGGIAVPYRTLTDLVKTFPKERIDLEAIIPEISEEPNDEQSDEKIETRAMVRVSCARSKSHIYGIARDKFPVWSVWPEMDSAFEVKIDPKVLKRGLDLTIFSSSVQDFRETLNGIQCKFKGSDLQMVSADGFRASQFSCQLAKSSDDEFEVIIPIQVVKEISRLLSAQRKNVRMRFSPETDEAAFEFETTKIESKLVRGQLVDLQRLMPETWETQVEIDGRDLKQSIQSIRAVAKKGSNIIRMEITGEESDISDCLTLSNISDDIGSNSDELPINKMKGANLKIAFNEAYMKDIGEVFGNESLRMEFTNAQSPGIFRFAGDDSYLHMAMPMYVQW